MALWRNTVLASLLTGSSLGAPTLSALSDPAALDALALELAPARAQVAQGLAARVELLGTVDHLDPETRALSQESLDLLAPLADRLGMARWRAELEDASFRLVQPAAYAALALVVGDDLSADRARVARLSTQVEGALADLGLSGEVTGRVKSLTSTHRKMARKGVALDQITDRLALRVKVQTVDDCYTVFSSLQSRFEVLDHETDDYIAQPKANGYRSLHTAVVAPDHPEPFELQVRTFAMHAAAEQGAAAHWRYKLGA